MKLQSIDIQLLKISQKADIRKMGLRQLGRLINESKPEHPQTIKHHLAKLDKLGLLKGKAKAKKFINLNKGKRGGKLFNLPILGLANCGQAEVFAEEDIMGYLKISSMLLNRKNPDGLFVVRAVGNSLNQALSVPGGPISDGDYVIVDSEQKSPNPGEYVLSVIEGAANLKRYFKRDEQIELVSESTEDISPIFIHEDEKDEYFINGVVVRVMKNSVNLDE
ncbi:S24 family peptidase [Patescibacteria group bacterium]|nr:S24 family peptidase [Patescibacteria group bacterium]MBU1563672.1 S24 family peptidase [Patescibacteria group bacterium]